MPTKHSKHNSSLQPLGNEAGVTLLELLIVIAIALIAFVGTVKLLGTSAINTDYVTDLAKVNLLANTKSTELMDKLDAFVAIIPTGQTSIGAVAPIKPLAGYHDIFDESGKPLCPADASGRPNCLSISQANVPAYVRQWRIVKDFPAPGDISVFVTVSHTTSKRVLRSISQTRTESVLKQ